MIVELIRNISKWINSEKCLGRWISGCPIPTPTLILQSSTTSWRRTTSLTRTSTQTRTRFILSLDSNIFQRLNALESCRCKANESSIMLNNLFVWDFKMVVLRKNPLNVHYLCQDEDSDDEESQASGPPSVTSGPTSVTSGHVSIWSRSLAKYLSPAVKPRSPPAMLMFQEGQGPKVVVLGGTTTSRETPPALRLGGCGTTTTFCSGEIFFL